MFKGGNVLETKEVFDSNTYPEDGEYIIYYFEPFKMWNVGEFYKDRCGESMVFGRSGFTSWHPEVTKGMKGE